MATPLQSRLWSPFLSGCGFGSPAKVSAFATWLPSRASRSCRPTCWVRLSIRHPNVLPRLLPCCLHTAWSAASSQCRILVLVTIGAARRTHSTTMSLASRWCFHPLRAGPTYRAIPAFRCLFVESHETLLAPVPLRMRAGLIYRAIPAFALRSIRYCVPLQVPHPPRDPWRRQATRRCTPGPFRPRAPATRRGLSHRTVSPAGCSQGSRTYSVCARIPVADGYFPGATLSAVSTVESRKHF